MTTLHPTTDNIERVRQDKSRREEEERKHSAEMADQKETLAVAGETHDEFRNNLASPKDEHDQSQTSYSQMTSLDNTKVDEFRSYDRDFLLQFMPIHCEKPRNISLPDAIDLEVYRPPPTGSTCTGRPVRVVQRPPPRRRTRPVSTFVDPNSPEVVEVSDLLKELTVQNFDSISDQIVDCANKEKDGRTLRQVILLIFDKAVNETAWSAIYARLCGKLMKHIGPDIQDDEIEDAQQRPVGGAQLFRRYISEQCQTDLDRLWGVKQAAASATHNANATENDSLKADRKISVSNINHAAQKDNRQFLGLVKFIGELFQLQPIATSERSMHQCLKNLLVNIDDANEEDIECLCVLLTTCGAILDTPKARAHMNVYFFRLNELVKSSKLSPRMRVLLQDIIDLRGRKWASPLSN